MAVVGLERTFYQVSEDVGMVEVCARTNCPINFVFAIRFSAFSGSVGDGNAGDVSSSDGSLSDGSAGDKHDKTSFTH